MEPGPAGAARSQRLGGPDPDDREPSRSIAKAISWRVTGTLDTFLISWLITGRPLLASGIAATEVLTKVTLFYVHERAWTRISWGRPSGSGGLPESPGQEIPARA